MDKYHHTIKRPHSIDLVAIPFCRKWRNASAILAGLWIGSHARPGCLLLWCKMWCLLAGVSGFVRHLSECKLQKLAQSWEFWDCISTSSPLVLWESIKGERKNSHRILDYSVFFILTTEMVYKVSTSLPIETCCWAKANWDPPIFLWLV
jgi:hypothetical protein